MNRRYFILSHNTYLKHNNNAICDLPNDFVNSSNPNKCIKFLNMTVFQDDDYIKYCSFHSPSLCDGNPSQNNYFITVSSPDHEVVQKDYPIASKNQNLVFYFRDINNQDIDITSLKFIIELELIY